MSELTVEKIKNVAGWVNSAEIKFLITELEMYQGLLEAEQEDCRIQRANKNHEWERASKLEIVVTKLNNDLLLAKNATLDECAILAETLKEDRFGKLPQFQVADAIREMKVEK